MRHNWWGRGIFALVVGVGLWAASGAQAIAAPYAAIVMDMRTGKVVHARGADRKQHPASLTKLMTLYLTFEAIESGQISLDTRVTVSRHAARQPRSKLYLKRGQRVTIRDLIRATAIKSANDAAMVLAEAIGGSQKRFAQLMTQKARDLGMTRTRFHNPHGLTSRGHLSTARDMARLARHLYFDFPQYYGVFSRKSARAAGKTVYTTNGLLASYTGSEGMKTGYTRAAGYNLVSTAKRGNKRIVAVVMGGKSTRTRNRRMRELLDMGFRRVPSVARVIKPGQRHGAVAKAPMPKARPGSARAPVVAQAKTVSELVAQVVASQAHAASTSGLSRQAPLYARFPRRRPATAVSGSPDRQLGELRVARSVGAVRPAARPAGWSVQVGVYSKRAHAVERLGRMPLSDLPMLADAAPTISQSRSRSGKPMYKVRFLGLEREDARAACARLKKAGRDCLALAPRK